MAIYIKNRSEFIIEKVLLPKEIHARYYSNISYRKFQEIIAIDPTKTTKNKTGKYSKWLLTNIIKFPEFLDNGELVCKLTDVLIIFDSLWFKTLTKKENINNDINSYAIYEFIKFMRKYQKRYEHFLLGGKKTEKEEKSLIKNLDCDLVYTDKKIDIVVPLNFESSYFISKDTEWCSINLERFLQLREHHIMFRIIPKDSKYDKVKVTVSKRADGINGFPMHAAYNMACAEYPEITGMFYPFSIDSNKLYVYENNLVNFSKKYPEKGNRIKNTTDFLTPDAITAINNYFNEYKNIQTEMKKPYIKQTLENFLVEEVNQDENIEKYEGIEKALMEILYNNSESNTDSAITALINKIISEGLENMSLVGFESEQDYFDFYLKFKNEIDEKLIAINFFDKTLRERNCFSLYDTITIGTKKAMVKFYKRILKKII